MNDGEYRSGIGDVRRLVSQRPPRSVRSSARRTPLQWTPLTASAALVASIFFAWVFLRAILTHVFPASPVKH
jgi:hypothetical protein